MANNSFYYYDHEACSFVQVEPNRKGLWLKAGAVVALALVLTAVGVGVLSQMLTSPAEIAQREEIEALQTQLEVADEQIAGFSDRLEDLAATDRELYRTVLNAEPITEDEFQLGVGGARDDDFGRFSTPTRELLRTTSARFDRLQRQLALQSESYSELRTIAGQRDGVLREQPAILPLSGARLTSGFGSRFHPILRTSRMHAGVDFPTPIGTPLVATGDGRISFVGKRSGYGNVIEVEHPLANKMTRYAHLTGPAPGIREGAAVTRGQTIAFSGNTGMSTGPHLHYEVRLLDEARTPINPVTTFVPDVTPTEYRSILRASRQPTASLD